MTNGGRGVPRRQVAWAFLRRDLRVALSYRFPFFLQVLAIAFTVVTFAFVAELVPPGEVPGGYFTFAITGIIVASFLTAATTTLGGSLQEEQSRGTLEAVIASGVPVAGLAIGFAAFPIVNAAVSSVAYVLVAALIGWDAVASANWSLAGVALLLGTISFAGVGFVGAALVLVFRRAGAVTGWLVALALFLGGELFPLSLLPGWLQAISWLSPFTLTLSLIRDALLEQRAWGESWGALAGVSVAAIAYVTLGLVALAAGLRHAKRVGTLGGY